MADVRELARLSDEAWRAQLRGRLLALDFDALEDLRGPRVATALGDLEALFQESGDDVRAAIVFLVQDLPAGEDRRLRGIAEAALALDADSRAIAVCLLTGDPGRFDVMLTRSMVDPAKVDREVERYLAGRREPQPG